MAEISPRRCAGVARPRAHAVSRSRYSIPTRRPDRVGGTGSYMTSLRRSRAWPRAPAAPADGCRRGSVQGRNDFGTAGYGGPCPPPGDKPHRYVFTLYALKTDSIEAPPASSPARIGVGSQCQCTRQRASLRYTGDEDTRARASIHPRIPAIRVCTDRGGIHMGAARRRLRRAAADRRSAAGRSRL